MNCEICGARREQAQSLARSIAPEDIKAGQYLAILAEVEETEPLFLTGESWRSADLPIRYESFCHYVEPLKVLAVCVPFVFIRYVTGDVRTLDCRQTRFAHLPEEYAEFVWKRHKARLRAAEGNKGSKRQR